MFCFVIVLFIIGLICQPLSCIYIFSYIISRQYCFQRFINQTRLMICFTLALWKQVLLLFLIILCQEFLRRLVGGTMCPVHGWLWFWFASKIKWVVTIQMRYSRNFLIALVVFPHPILLIRFVAGITTVQHASSFGGRVIVWALRPLFELRSLWRFILLTLPSIFEYK